MRPVGSPCPGCGTPFTLAETDTLDALADDLVPGAAELLERLEAAGDPRGAGRWELWTCPSPACDCGCRAWRPVREAPAGGGTPCGP